MNFGEALALLKKGELVSRKGWNGKGMWIALQKSDANSKMTLPYIFMRTVTGDLVPWLASQTDMLAYDWELVEVNRIGEPEAKTELTLPMPSLGRIVLVKTHGEQINGQEEHAAMVTQVWGPKCINVTVFPGFGEPRCYSSIEHESRFTPVSGSITWRWPPRV